MSLASAIVYAYIFFQSALIEAVFLRMAFGRHVPKGFWAKSLTINALTHPIVIYLLLADGTFTNLQGAIIAEMFAVLVETGLLKLAFTKLDWYRSFCLSLVANLLSWQVAPLLTWLVVKLFL